MPNQHDYSLKLDTNVRAVCNIVEGGLQGTPDSVTVVTSAEQLTRLSVRTQCWSLLLTSLSILFNLVGRFTN
jgi:hypothetical protein